VHGTSGSGVAHRLEVFILSAYFKAALKQHHPEINHAQIARFFRP
jgi:hypothetical protein